MDNGRDKQKNHIRAAREWLGEAETSLECENDVQGDLKLMLARAELARVKDTPKTRRLKARATRVLPAIFAAVIVAIGLWLLPTGSEGTQEGSATQAVTAVVRDNSAASDASGKALAASDATPLPEVLPGANGTTATDTRGTAESSQITSAVATTATASAAPVETDEVAAPATAITAIDSAATAPTANSAAPPAPPTAEMQQLMQSAGKILRQ